jgi:hypothetical protein
VRQGLHFPSVVFPHAATLPQVRISALLEALLAPALLPRGYVNQQLLLAAREVRQVWQQQQGSQLESNFTAPGTEMLNLQNGLRPADCKLEPETGGCFDVLSRHCTCPATEAPWWAAGRNRHGPSTSWSMFSRGRLRALNSKQLGAID